MSKLPKTKNPKLKERLTFGFTMLELLMVMGIIGVLASFVLVTYPAAQKRARDANRKSDLKQYQTALEVYANRNDGFYPSRTTANDPSSSPVCSTDLGFDSGDCPLDPKNNQAVCDSGSTCGYNYISDGSGGGTANALDYVLWGALEQPESDTYWIVCSSGKTGEGATAPTDANCPI